MADRIICGIDVGSSKIATIVAKISEEEKMPRVMGFSMVPSRGVKRGQITDINQVTDAVESSLEQAERMAGIKVQSAIVSVGGPHIESLNSQGVVAVSQPDVEISDGDIARVIDAAKAISLSSTREIIEVIPREFIVDGQASIKNPIGMSGVRLEVNTHIITASHTNLKNMERCMSDLGISIDAFVFSGLASSISAVTDTEKELGVVLVDIGGGKIDIGMYVEGALSYSASIPIGSRHITNDIAVGLRVSLESAERIKLFLQGKGPDQADKKSTKSTVVDLKSLRLPEGLDSINYKDVVHGIMRPRLEEMFERVYAEIEESGFDQAQVPSGLVITGGGAMTSEVVETAQRVIGMSARVGKPSHVTGLIDEVTFPQYATVVGLLLYAKDLQDDEREMNFKDFDKIFRNISVKGSVSKVRGLIKSFIP